MMRSVTETAVWRLLSGAALVLALTSAALGESLEEQITHYLERARATEDAPGISAAVALEGRILYAGGVGYADLNHRVPAGAETVYNIGSVSKVNAVVGIMQLVQEGRVDLDAPIQTWVEGFPEKSGPISLRHLLTHTSGIRHYRPGDFNDGEGFRENLRRFDSIDEAIEIFAADELLFAPGEYWSYSSYATNLLQAVIEETTEMGFEPYLTTFVWEPAGMLQTAFDIPERIVPHRARGYRRGENGRLQHEPYGDVTYKFAAGGMISTVVDQARLGIALNNGVLLDAETVALMYTPWTEAKQRYRGEEEPRDLDFQQALLWRVEEDWKGRRFVHHGGSVLGFRTAFVNYPEEDLVVVVMINVASNPHRYARALAKMLLERPGIVE